MIAYESCNSLCAIAYKKYLHLLFLNFDSEYCKIYRIIYTVHGYNKITHS